MVLRNAKNDRHDTQTDKVYLNKKSLFFQLGKYKILPVPDIGRIIISIKGVTYENK